MKNACKVYIAAPSAGVGEGIPMAQMTEKEKKLLEMEMAHISADLKRLFYDALGIEERLRKVEAIIEAQSQLPSH